MTADPTSPPTPEVTVQGTPQLAEALARSLSTLADLPEDGDWSNVAADIAALQALAQDPVLQMLSAPNSAVVEFPYGDSTLVLLASSPDALARQGRAFRITRSRRSGRRGHRTWQIEVRPVAQLPRPAVATKPR